MYRIAIVDDDIEAILKIKDKDKRTISIVINTFEQFLSINSRNFYTGDLSIGKDGLPLTTKKDKDYHGYGMKSIQLLVEQYQGEMTLKTDNHIFQLSILFPIPNKAQDIANSGSAK